MLVLIANNLPAAVRGRLKLWFVEPRPNIFISGVKDSVAKTVVDYLYKNCPPESGVLIARSIRAPPGFEIICIGPLRKPVKVISGLQLIVETLRTR